MVRYPLWQRISPEQLVINKRFSGIDFITSLRKGSQPFQRTDTRDQTGVGLRGLLLNGQPELDIGAPRSVLSYL